MHDDPRRPQLTDDPADLLVRSGLIDVDYVQAQLGTPVDSPEEAAAAVIEAGDVSPHPLVEVSWLGRKRAWNRAGVHPIVWYLAVHRRRTRLATHPLVEPRQICADIPDARFHPYGALAYWLSQATDDTPLPTRLLPGEVTWGDYRAAAITGARAWREGQTRRRPKLHRGDVGSAPTPVQPDGTVPVSILMACQDSAPRLRQTIDALQSQTTTDWELVVVDLGSRDDSVAVLRGLAAFEPRIRVVPSGRTTTGAGLNLALGHAQGTHIAFITPGREWLPDQLATLLGHARQSGAPVVLAGAGPVARSRRELLAGRTVDLDSWLVQRSAIDAVDGFDADLGGATHRDLALRLSREHDLRPVDAPVHRRPERSQPAGDDWTSVVLERQLVDWETRAGHPTDDTLVSHILPIGSEPRGTIDWLHALPRTGVELVTVGVRLKRSGYVLSHALGAVLDRVTFVPVTAEVNVSTVLNIGMAHAKGSTLVLVRPETMPPRDPGFTGRLVAALDDGVAVVQPVVLGPDGVVSSAGARFEPTHAHPGVLLEGHPLADAQRMGPSTVSATASPIVALRTGTAVALSGLSCRFRGAYADTDLCLRAHAELGGRSVVAPSAVISSRVGTLPAGEHVTALVSLAGAAHSIPPADTTAHLRAAGFEVTDRRSRRVTTNAARLAAASVLLPEPVVRTISGINESPPRLRWTIDIAAPAATRGDRWGDTFFAASLAAALERRGQDVAVDRRDSRHRDTRDHDDVLLVLRGLDRVTPRPGLLNLMWVISHPDMVSREELASYDAVYAASLSWSAQVSEEWGLPVTPLLQCTDARWFNPERAAPGTGPDVVFIGNSRGVYRFAVRTALGAHLPLTLHGNDWHPFVPPHLVSSLAVANDQVGAIYGSAGVVLNDHHLDMRRDSFLSNRLFDAVACGARVATDPVEGLDEIFGGAVQPFRNERELAALCSAPHDAFPDDATRLAIARKVVTEHSFDARAETLVDEAVRRLRQR